jgi:hypothetical protein
MEMSDGLEDESSACALAFKGLDNTKSFVYGVATLNSRIVLSRKYV